MQLFSEESSEEEEILSQDEGRECPVLDNRYGSASFSQLQKKAGRDKTDNRGATMQIISIRGAFGDRLKEVRACSHWRGEMSYYP